MGRLAGNMEMTVDDPVLHLLGLRQLALVWALECRGHAAMRPIEGDLLALAAAADPAGAASGADHEAGAEPQADAQASEPLHRLPPDVQAILDEARGHPAWSTIGEESSPDPRRDQLIGQMAHALFLAL
jgi:hypothetical protein